MLKNLFLFYTKKYTISVFYFKEKDRNKSKLKVLLHRGKKKSQKKTEGKK